jgi:dihydroorotase
MDLLIKNGRIIDPANNKDEIADLLIVEGKIAPISTNLKEMAAAKVIEAQGLVVCPGFIDLHVHLREPGREDEETIASGTRAAAKGGFTSVCCMPNTEPVNDTPSVTEHILAQARKEGIVNVYPIGCISKGLKGEELAEIGYLKEAGCVAISDDGKSVMNAGLMRRAMEYTLAFGLPVIEHCEDLNLTAKGVAHEGKVATELGLAGYPSLAEEAMVARNILLAEYTGARLHIAHVSAKGSVELIRQAKARGVKVTAEATPHHFTLTEEAVREFSTNAKMNPPLRSQEDRQALLKGLQDGTIDVIATDHAPHNANEKDLEFDLAPFGVIGLETAVGLGLTELVAKDILTLPQFVAKMTFNPAKVLGLPKGTLSVGADADITILDLSAQEVVKVEGFLSKSKNSPFIGRKLKGLPHTTIVGGKIVWSRNQ